MKRKFYTSFVPLFLIFIGILISPSLFGQVTPGDPAAIPVEFRFTHSLSAEDSGVGINGNMNDWGAIYKMHEVESNLWKGTLELQPRSYEYKFVKYVDTTSQAGVTGYFTDPLNADFGGPFNNSFLNVIDPMVYYFLPKNGSVTANLKPRFTANFAVANNNSLDVDKIEFSIDGVPIADAKNYYDASKKMLIYDPPAEFEPGEHTAYVKIFNASGGSAELTTTFTIASGIVTANHTFIFDSKSPGFNFLSEVERVDVKGTFNSEGLDAMKDSNGIYTVTKELTLNKPEEYTYIINGGSYINDPDNPVLSSKHRTQITKELNPRAEFRNFSPESGMAYTSPLSSLQIRSYISPSDSGYPLTGTSIIARYDGVIVRPTRTPSGTGYDLLLTIDNPTEGRHVLEYSGRDDHSNNAWVSNYVFGVYPPDSGFHYPDNENDDKGTGNYTYPGVPAGSADIREVNITASQNLDSLKFNIKMETVNQYTRLGFSIVNNLNGVYTEAMQDVELRIPEWNGKGIFLILAAPNSAYLDSAYENILFISRSPLQTSVRINVNASAIASGEINFSLPLSLLEGVMGTYKDSWYLGIYSYLKNQNGTIEVNSGSSPVEDPDVYDVIFFADQKFQERLLSNYSSPDDIGGPRIAVIGKEQRGYGAILPSQINPLLGQAPEIKIYAGGGELLKEPVLVKGYADVPTGTMVTINNNNDSYFRQTDPLKEFEINVSLTEGLNEITASVTYGFGMVSTSKPVVYNYIVDHKPVAKIYYSLVGSDIFLYADSSYDPDGTNLVYSWTQDENNPEEVALSSYNGGVTSFNVPATPGEYYFNLKVTNAAEDTAWARTVVLLDDLPSFPDNSTWHPAWVDSAVFYCVFVRTFDASGTFNGLASRMQELKDLGITGIWLLPIHPSTGNMGPDNPGYAITNYLDVLQDYGKKEDFKNLVNTAHQYGIRIILDHVIQHTSDLHPFMKDANRYKDASPYYPFYTWDSNNNFRYLFTWVDLPSINYENADTRDYLIRMAKYWVQEFNIDGYRCDVAWAIDSLRASGPAFWQRWRRELKSIKPDIFLLAEGDAWQRGLFDEKFDAAYDWRWFGAIRGVISGTQTIETLNSWINSYYSPGYPKHSLTFKFLENQDEQRFIEAYGIGNTKLAAAHLLTAPGVPMLYAGQEVGEITNRGNISWSDPNNLLPYYKRLIDVRKKYPALAYGDFTRITNTEPTKVYSYLRTSGSSNAIVTLNFSSENVTTNISVPLNKLAFDSTSSYYLSDVLNGPYVEISGTALKDYQVTLPPNSAQIFILSNEPIVDVEEKDKQVPLSFNLMQNYPNPFNPSTTIRYSLPAAGRVKISVYNVLGQRVEELLNKEQGTGYYDVVWNAGNYASGIYIYSIEVTSLQGGENFRAAKKMILVK
jgi:cyclomaltodextrinase